MAAALKKFKHKKTADPPVVPPAPPAAVPADVKKGATELNLFVNPQIELPNLCKEKLDDNKQVSLAVNGGKIMECWKNAGAQPDATFITLPFLTVL